MKPLQVLILCLAVAITANTQTVDFYGKQVAKDICNQYGMKDDEEAKNSLDKICDAADIPDNFVLAPCTGIDNCFALYKNGYSYIVYDINFFNKVKTYGFTDKNLPKNNVDWVAITILAHEIGHHMCLHTTNPNLATIYTPVQIELQADEYAGTILYKLGATLAQAQQAMYSNDVPDAATLTHPARKDRLDAIAKGWNKEYQKYLAKNRQQQGGVTNVTNNEPNNPVNPPGGTTNQYSNITNPPSNPVQPANNPTRNKLQQADDYFNAKDYASANRIYKSMNEADLDGNALFNYGKMFQLGLGGAGVVDYASAKYYYEKSANLGVGRAMNNLGVLYAYGYGVAKDYATAKAWYEKAAAQGIAIAMDNLGTFYEYGYGVGQDYTMAKVWYEKAANTGFSRSMVSIGDLYFKGLGVGQDYTQAKTWYQKAADAGMPEGMNHIGFLYANGYGVGQSYEQAKYWYEKAAAAGSGMAMNNLGAMYQNGNGVMRDLEQAKIWYQRAADSGIALAMRNIAAMYYSGIGVVQDYAQAKYWYEKAANAGDADAMCSMGLYFMNGGYGYMRDYTQAKYWFEKAAEAGNADAINNIGVMYEYGYGVMKNFFQAKAWFKKACDAGSTKGCENLRKY